MARILLVDDEDAVREVLARRLRGWGHEVEAVGSTVSALERLAITDFAVVLCDVLMPIHDGVWLLEQISARWPTTAVVMLSGGDNPQTVNQTRRLGAAAYLTKPIDRDRLYQARLDALETWRRKSQRNPR